MSEQSQGVSPEQVPAPVRDHRVTTLVGAGLLAAGATLGVGIAALEVADNNHTISQEVPYMPEAQRAVNSIEDGFALYGAVALPIAVVTIGGVKLAARRKPVAGWLDKSSSQEPTNDGTAQPGVVRRALRATLTDKVSAVTIAATTVGAMTAGISAEVAEGPGRPIEALNRAIPGEAMIVPYKDLMPMAQGSIDAQATARMVKAADKHHVAAHPIAMNLGVLQVPGRESATDLVVGMDVPETSPAHWSPNADCIDVPIIIDKAAHVETGTRVVLNGVTARVAGQTEGTSAINRIGITMDRQALQTCLDRSVPGEGTNHAIVIEADVSTAEQIVRDAQLKEQPATVISKDAYLENSKDFWVKNVKPITSVLEGIAGGMAVVALTGSITARLQRNRREYAAKLARGYGTSRIRAAELLRTAKEGVIASAAGGVLAVPATIAVNATELGFRAGVGVHELLVGAGIAMSSVIGGLIPLSRLRTKLNPTKFTR